MFKKYKKVVFLIITLFILFSGGIAMGINKTYNSKAITITSIADDKSYNNLLPDVCYEITNKNIFNFNNKIEAKFNVFSEDLTDVQAQNLSKKIYENTVCKQKGLTSVEVYFFSKKDKNSCEFLTDFYGDNLKYKVVYDKEFNQITFSDFYNIPKITADVNKIQYAINYIKSNNGVVMVDMAMLDGLKMEDVISEIKGLLEQIKLENNLKNIDVEEANVTCTETNGWAYNTKFTDIISKTKKSTIY